MNRFRNIHKGKRAFIVATGPSLNETPLEKLKGEITFGLNRVYLKRELDLTYMVTIAEAVERHYGREIVDLPVVACFGGRVLNSYPNKGNVFKFKWSDKVPFFTGDPTKPMRQGHTVTYAAIQLAYFMGLSEVYLVGLDHYFDYSNFEKVSKGVASLGKDTNHFDLNYFEKGHDHLRAEPKQTQEYYRHARVCYENEGRILANASSHTALDEKYLPKISFESLFN